MAVQRWACIAALGSHRLRRGSWFEVLDDSEALTVTLSVNGSPQVIERTALSIRSRRAVAWTVVEPQRPESFWRSPYAVCPGCLGREPLVADATEMACPRCGLYFPIDWPAHHAADTLKGS